MRETHIIQPSRRTFLKTLALGIAACAVPESASHALAAMSGSGKTLVVYFSWPETLNPHNMSDDEANSTVVINGKVLGNTQYVAMVIAKATGAELFRIEPVNPWPLNHKLLIAQAKIEQMRDYRPAIAKPLENFQDFDTIFLGYPNWWADLPMILYTFLETYDFSGKRIIPFSTHGGSGFSGTIRTIADLQPKAEVVRNGYTVSRDVVAEAAPEVTRWVKEKA
ncbi:flavodoxin [Desulfosediminicola flagellatus]|uniref:flavodoxin n=1 Tax=Desulfosediminicola flagellatus TaxID=2569541 RepID=UPI0010AD4E1C|nr:flavodoxin [Desulfosediminicola flagellatus]